MSLQEYGINDTQLKQLKHEVIDVLEFGAKKYGKANWKTTTNFLDNCNAAKRHIHEALKGLEHDEDTNKHPLIHALCRILFAHCLKGGKE